MTKTTGSDLLVRALRAEGVDTVFGVAGDHILHMLDTMFDEPLRTSGTSRVLSTPPTLIRESSSAVA